MRITLWQTNNNVASASYPAMRANTTAHAVFASASLSAMGENTAAPAVFSFASSSAGQANTAAPAVFASASFPAVCAQTGPLQDAVGDIILLPPRGLRLARPPTVCNGGGTGTKLKRPQSQRIRGCCSSTLAAVFGLLCEAVKHGVAPGSGQNDGAQLYWRVASPNVSILARCAFEQFCFKRDLMRSHFIN
jgi:hypothetical protein